MSNWVESLPAVNATLNGSAFLLLVTGWILIKRGHRDAHKRVMLSAFTVSILFLVCYVIYHVQVGSKSYTGTGAIRGVYYIILVTHVVLATSVPVLAIITIRRALRGDLERHRRIARVTLPIWVYVSITGVIIYVMLYHGNTPP